MIKSRFQVFDPVRNIYIKRMNNAQPEKVNNKYKELLESWKYKNEESGAKKQKMEVIKIDLQKKEPFNVITCIDLTSEVEKKDFVIDLTVDV